MMINLSFSFQCDLVEKPVCTPVEEETCEIVTTVIIINVIIVIITIISSPLLSYHHNSRHQVEVELVPEEVCRDEPKETCNNVPKETCVDVEVLLYHSHLNFCSKKTQSTILIVS